MRDSDHRASPRVVHVITSTHRRGAETYALALHEAMADAGARTQIVALAAAPPGAPSLPVPVVGDGADGRRSGLRQVLREADVAIAHGSRTLRACAVATAGLRTRYAYRVIGETRHWAVGIARRVLVGALLHRAAAVVTYHDDATADVRSRYGLRAARVHTIPKGVRATAIAAPTATSRSEARDALGIDAATLVLCLGALAPEKDLTLAIDAVAELGHGVLALVGDGPDRDALAAHAVRSGVSALLPGSTAEPQRWLRAADVVLLTSRTEGVPGALLEAALAGTPAVSVDVGGVRQVIDDGRTGRVVEERDPAALAAALGAVLADPAPMGAAARRRALEHADLDQIAQRWIALAASISP